MSQSLRLSTNLTWLNKYLIYCFTVFQFSSAQSLSCAQLFATPWTAGHQAPLSMRFSRQGYWSGLPFPSPGDLPNPGIEPRSPVLQADSLLSELQGKPHSLLEKCKSKLQWDIISHQSEWLSSKSLQTINAGESVEKREHSCPAGGNVNWYRDCGRWYGDSLKN